MTRMVHVPASKSGVTVLVAMDATDVAWLGRRRLAIGSHGYAQIFDNGRVCLLHRALLGLQRGDHRLGDHIDGNPMNCTRSNLRIVNSVASSCNTRGWSSAGYRGVYRTRHGKPFVAKATVAGRTTVIGQFDTAEEADAAAHRWRQDNMPGYVDRPGARRVDEFREPDADTLWWQILEWAGGLAPPWRLSRVETRYRAQMGHDASDGNGWQLAEFLTALQSGQVAS